ncbi:hypothetical protein [Mycobacterium intracellulare]|uniref:hypothetical protein n=1 Tax=Mycobacterium intracellulare TaxID=1767 RepID=UPI00109EA247|nr:hypothetical protein [Mycobacterium intracellulare]
MGVWLSAGAMGLSAAELAADIVCVNVLAYMGFELAANLRALGEVAAYARYVATCCGVRRRRRHPGGAVPRPAGEEARGAALQAVGQECGGLAGRVLNRVRRIEGLLAAGPRTTVDYASGAGDVVVSLDSAGRLAGVSLSAGCTSRYSAAELTALLNSMLGAAGRATVVGRRQPIPA